MICRNIDTGELLKVNNLNEINVCVDRSETYLTETALNSWRPGLVGPPHLHETKEQMFLILNGEATIKAGNETFEVETGDLVYIPANMVHQSIVKGDETLQYFLFNAYLNSDKEGHSSFKDHIEKVKDIRSKQAREQQAGVVQTEAEKPVRQAKLARNVLAPNGGEIVFIRPSDTQKCEAIAMTVKGSLPSQTHADKEQTIYIASGAGTISVGDESSAVAARDTVFVPANTAFSIQPATGNITYVALNTFI